MGRNLDGRIVRRGISLVTTSSSVLHSTEPRNAKAVLLTDVAQTLSIGHRPWTKHEHYRSNPRQLHNANRLSPTLQRPTLVLNRNWQPINVATVARALIMLWNDLAKIVDPIDYQLYDWSDWSRLVPDRDEPFHPVSASAHSYPRGHCIDHVRCNADADSYLQPQKRIQGVTR